MSVKGTCGIPREERRAALCRGGPVDRRTTAVMWEHVQARACVPSDPLRQGAPIASPSGAQFEHLQNHLTMYIASFRSSLGLVLSECTAFREG